MTSEPITLGIALAIAAGLVLGSKLVRLILTDIFRHPLKKTRLEVQDERGPKTLVL